MANDGLWAKSTFFSWNHIPLCGRTPRDVTYLLIIPDGMWAVRRNAAMDTPGRVFVWTQFSLRLSTNLRVVLPGQLVARGLTLEGAASLSVFLVAVPLYVRPHQHCLRL